MTNDKMIQWDICQKWGAEFLYTKPFDKLGLAANVKEGQLPINGLRHRPVGDTCGWYIWAGTELKEDDDFFLPVHVVHLDDCCPSVKKYLGLAPGWRFLATNDYEDVWFDPNLLL